MRLGPLSGLADTAAFPEGQYNVVMAACHAGPRIEAHYYPGQDHSGTVNASLVDSIPFVKKILAGESIEGKLPQRSPSSGEGLMTPGNSPVVWEL
jgi:hypothetical protein